MNIPGFTADKSVSRCSGQYRNTASFGTLSAADGLSMQASPSVLSSGLARGTDLFRCCGFVPQHNRFYCVAQRASPLENCRCTRDNSGFPVILCSPPVIAPTE
jgi:hypothetical protein